MNDPVTPIRGSQAVPGTTGVGRWPARPVSAIRGWPARPVSPPRWPAARWPPARGLHRLLHGRQLRLVCRASGHPPSRRRPRRRAPGAGCCRRPRATAGTRRPPLTASTFDRSSSPTAARPAPGHAGAGPARRRFAACWPGPCHPRDRCAKNGKPPGNRAANAPPAGRGNSACRRLMLTLLAGAGRMVREKTRKLSLPSTRPRKAGPETSGAVPWASCRAAMTTPAVQPRSQRRPAPGIPPSQAAA